MNSLVRCDDWTPLTRGLMRKVQRIWARPWQTRAMGTAYTHAAARRAYCWNLVK